ncbi:unnamed protein product [Owenia fusiformis]|uniref:Uncharacterized protein n=1 Tax=Owenia fusiformis TaxID=6347 RepID=A0A8J1TCQ7_OWEFU|nr:unnamed protein product [Owenia fusiformis]
MEYHENRLEMRKEIYGDQPHSDIAASLDNIGKEYNNKGDLKRDIKHHGESLTMRSILYGDQENIGKVYSDKGDSTKAAIYHEESMAIRRQCHGDQLQADTEAKLGNADNDKERNEKAKIATLKIQKAKGYQGISGHSKKQKSKAKHREALRGSIGNKFEVGENTRDTNEQSKVDSNLTKEAIDTTNRTSDLFHLVNDTKRICSLLSDETAADLANIENCFLQKLDTLENQIEVDTTEHRHKLVIIKDTVDLTFEKEEIFNKVIKVLQEESQWIKSRLANLESGIQKHFFQVLKNLFVQHQRTDKFITRQEDSIKQLDTAMADSQLAVHNGIMILPIEDFQAKFQAAKVRDPASITSPAFYTRRGGYKLKIRVYPNGDGLGLGTHVSIYIMMCKSPFDALLPWPFNQKITLGIMNQTDSKKDYMDAFRPNKALNTWGKPVAESNVPTGIPKFLDLATVLDPSQGYVVDDTMYVKVIVEQEPKTPLSAFLGYKEIEEQ